MIDRRVVVSMFLCSSLAVGCGSMPSQTDTRPTPVASTVGGAAQPTLVDPVASAYEAVFLRLDVVDSAPEVIVVGVDRAGRERQIARLPGAWALYRIRTNGGPPFLAPRGAVSTTGLLAIPSNRGAMEGRVPLMRWEIFDLHHPEAAPRVIAGIEQDIDVRLPYDSGDRSRPRVNWLPGERLAVPWQSCDATSCGIYAFFDGRTGAAIPRLHAERSCRTVDGSGAEILVVDGFVVRRDTDGRRLELSSPGGVGSACLAPDDSMIVHDIAGDRGRLPSDAAAPLSGLIIPGSGTWTAIEGNFAGWLATTP